MTESNILTPQQVSMANEAEPHEVLLAIHKRVVDTEKLMVQYRTHAQNMDVEVGMLKERIEKLEGCLDVITTTSNDLKLQNNED
jgi:hypothetical protein|tara:strand:+ start:190 stop:441 length:252 start_codon:yes stop_codon:yes gene_type:complete